MYKKLLASRVNKLQNPEIWILELHFDSHWFESGFPCNEPNCHIKTWTFTLKHGTLYEQSQEDT